MKQAEAREARAALAGRVAGSHQITIVADSPLRVVADAEGNFPNGVHWGRAPGQPRLGAEAEQGYREEQQT